MYTPDKLERIAVVYHRSAALSQRTDNAITKAVREQIYHAENLGWPPDRVMVMVDTGVPPQIGPAWAKLMRLIVANEVGLVLGRDLSRFARNAQDRRSFRDRLARHRVALAVDGTLVDLKTLGHGI